VKRTIRLHGKTNIKAKINKREDKTNTKTRQYSLKIRQHKTRQTQEKRRADKRRQDKTRQEKRREDKTRQDKTRQDKTDKTRQGKIKRQTNTKEETNKMSILTSLFSRAPPAQILLLQSYCNPNP
jgi:hypothetical protein